MRACRTAMFLLVITGLITSSFASSEYSSVEAAKPVKSQPYWRSSTCHNCHTGIFDQHLQSMHAKSFTNPVFQAQYFKEFLPSVSMDATLSTEAKGCIACHSPIAYLTSGGKFVTKDQVDPEMSGVTCDFCHTIKGYKDNSPGNGNYVSEPGGGKLGPFRHESTWHHVYSELHTKSEFCAICHNQVNRQGVEIKSTYTEWKESPYKKEGIQCQDCHMNAVGFLTAGRPVYESGRAARITLSEARYRPKLYTHRFPGAHSKSQVIGALKLDIKVTEQTVSAGDEMTIDVFIDNSRTGHKMPSGSTDLRLLWCELKAYVINDKTMSPIPVAIPPDSSAGNGGNYRDMVKDDIPEGSRIYRAIFLDKAGKQTLSSYNAAKIIFDNRLNAAEIRRETYRFRIPESAEDKLYLVADLNYLPYSGVFAKRLGLPKPDRVVIASTKKEIALK